MAVDSIRSNIEDGTELSDKQLDAVAGGYVFYTGESYEVIDEKGDVVKTVWGNKLDDHWRACRYARELGLSEQEITWYELDALRRANQ